MFSTRLRDVFVAPKLAALWLLLAVGLLVVAAGLVVASPSGAPIRWTPAIDIPLLSFLGLNLLAWLASTDRHQSLFGERLQYQGLLTLLLYLGLFVLARHAVCDVRALRLLFAGIASGAILVAGYAILQKAGLDPFWSGPLPRGRVFSTFGQPNSLAGYLLVAIPPTVCLARLTSGVQRAVLIAATAEILVALVLTSSRGGVVGLAAMALLPLWLLRRRKGVALLAAGAAVAGAVVAVMALPGRSGDGRLSIENHLDQWKVAARIALDHPLLGTGSETFPDVFPRYSHSVLAADRAAYFDSFRVESAHNVYLTMAANTGVISLVAFVALIAVFVFLALRAAEAASDPSLRLGLLAVVASVLGHLGSDAFMTAEVTGSGLQWTLLGAGTALVCVGVRSGSFPAQRAGRRDSRRKPSHEGTR